MKGLIFRELYLTRKTYISALVTYALIMILCVLLNLSCSFGNLKDIIAAADDPASMLNTLFYVSVITPSAVLYIMSAANFELVDKDVASKWLTFQYSTPVSEKKYAFVKVLIIFFSVAMAFILSLATAALFCGLYGRSLERELLGIITVLAPVTAMLSAALITLTLLLRSSTSASITVLAVVLAICYPFFMKLIIMSDNGTEISLMPYLSKAADFIPAYPMLMLIILALGQLCIMAVLNRRENYRIRSKKEAAEK